MGSRLSHEFAANLKKGQKLNNKKTDKRMATNYDSPRFTTYYERYTTILMSLEFASPMGEHALKGWEEN